MKAYCAGVLLVVLFGGTALSFAEPVVEGRREAGAMRNDDSGREKATVTGERRRDHERARTALENGEILPLATLLERVSRSHPGEVMAVELEAEDGHWRYELKILLQDGRLGKVEVDARTGEVIGMRLKGDRKDRRDGAEKDRRAKNRHEDAR